MNSDTEFLGMFKTFAVKVEQEVNLTNLSMDTEISSLGIDSVSMMEIVGEIEDEMNVIIPDEKLAHLRTVGDINTVIKEQSVE